MLHSAIMAKNRCLASAVCPQQFAVANTCTLNPDKVASGECDALLTQASKCKTDFWERVLNPDVERGMQDLANCTELCRDTVMAHAKCLQQAHASPQMAQSSSLMKCTQERFAAELCLGGCLDPAKKKEYGDCVAAKGVEGCKALQGELISRREVTGRRVLRSMGFSEEEVNARGVEPLMDLTGTIVMMSFFEDELGKGQ